MVQIIGIGNPLRHDDGAGPAVVQRLRQQLPPTVTIIEHNGDGANLMECWDSTDEVVLVDAACSGGEPGTVYRFDASETPLSRGLFHYSSHLFSVAEAVEMARSLGRLPKRLIVYGIEGAMFDYGVGLSPTTASAVETVAKAILADLRA